ncbi:NlpC/P60 family protein [Silvibacterium acidisoli]|uniref:NlpC/P60 family protein n=1 Tax=Acidobacteriaceae bacterium ZG23-2 TaxID=2883246 RepID=UPI00406BE8BF
MPARPNRIPQSLYLDLLAIPYVEHGRTLEGMDCVGLFMEIQRRLGRHLPVYESDPTILADSLIAWERVETPEAGDGVLLFSSDPPWHLATVIGPNEMIHGKEGAGMVVERFDTPAHRRCIEGFYRWKSQVPAPSV